MKIPPFVKGQRYFYNLLSIFLQGVIWLAYRIEYASGGAIRSDLPRKSSRLAVMTAGAFAAFLILVHVFWPVGDEKLRNILIPGDPDVTVAAFSQMVDQLQCGDPLSDAVEGFCREIFAHAEIPDRA